MPFYDTTNSIHPNYALHQLLEALGGKSLIDVDFGQLPLLEGRSNNTVALFFDTLLFPKVDEGHDLSSLVRWQKTGRKLSFIGVADDRPGGSWHQMQRDFTTLSPAMWMSIPNDMQRLPRHELVSRSTVAVCSVLAFAVS